MRCSTQTGTFNSNLLEHVAKLWLLFYRIKRGKTSSVSKQHNIIAQYSYDISSLRKISNGLSSNQQTGNFAQKCKFAPYATALHVFNFSILCLQCFSVSWKHSQHYLPVYGKMKIELSTCWTKFETKAATYLEQTVNKYSSIATTTSTLQSSHENEYPV